MDFINIHTHNFLNQETVLEIYNQYPSEFSDSIPYYSIGIHPWYIDDKNLEAEIEVINQKILESNCLAIGECGLDKRIDIPFDLQEKVFSNQLLLAQKHHKPVIIHCVSAFQELIVLKKNLNITVPMIVHGFSKNVQLMRQLIDNGFYLSFGKSVLLKPAMETVLQTIPDDRFFLETDVSNEKIEKIYNRVTQYKKWTAIELKQQIKSNFATVFKKTI